MTPYIVAGSLLLAALAGFQGYRMGAAQNEAQHILEATRHANESIILERDRLEAERQKILMSQELEDQAYAQPTQGIVCLPADRVMRLNQR
jgi:hypothetical protein